jgi:acyl dehydratase
VRSRGTVIDKYERRGKPYMVTEYVTENADGTPLVRGQFTQMLFREEWKTGGPPRSQAAVEDARGSAAGVRTSGGLGAISGPPGEMSLVKTISQRQIDAYSGVRFRSIHTDEDWARAKGFRAPLAQAMMSTAYVSELMTRFCGAGFVKGGAMSMSFINPVFAGDRLTIRGVAKQAQPEGSGERVVVDVSCENEQGQPTAIGTASGLRMD